MVFRGFRKAYSVSEPKATHRCLSLSNVLCEVQTSSSSGATDRLQVCAITTIVLLCCGIIKPFPTHNLEDQGCPSPRLSVQSLKLLRLHRAADVYHPDRPGSRLSPDCLLSSAGYTFMLNTRSV